MSFYLLSKNTYFRPVSNKGKGLNYKQEGIQIKHQTSNFKPQTFVSGTVAEWLG
jgi:hypothetical protein